MAVEGGLALGHTLLRAEGLWGLCPACHGTRYGHRFIEDTPGAEPALSLEILQD